MNRYLSAALALAFVLPAGAQRSQSPAAPAATIVASVNGETVTRARFDELWNRVPEHLQRQYELAGGKPTFLDNYIRKRLLLQHAFRTGFAPEAAANRAALTAAEESAVFDRYIREVLAREVVTDELVRSTYIENRRQFAHPEQVKLRHLLISTTGRTVDEARERIAPLLAQLTAYRKEVEGRPEAARLLRDRFAELASEHSHDESASDGGLVGWIGMSKLDPAISQVAFNMETGSMSGIVQSGSGLHILYIDDHREAGVEPFESAEPGVREFLLKERMQQIMQAVNERTNELLASADVKVFKENL